MLIRSPLSWLMLVLAAAVPLLGQSDGAQRWAYTTGGSIASSPAVGPDGTIYFGSQDNYLYALSPAGALLWRYRTTDFVDSVPAVKADGTIYFGSWSGVLTALNPNGTKKWEYATGSFIVSSPALAADGTLYVGSGDFSLHAVNADGTARWKYLTGDWVDSSPAIAADGTIYFGSWDNSFYALKPDGSLKWSYATGAEILSSPAIAADGTVYIGSNDKKLYAFSPNGTKLWEFATGNGIEGSPVVDADGTVYIASKDNKLYALTASGAQRWVYTSSASLVSTPALRNGSLILGTSANSVVGIDTKNGNVLWTAATGDWVDSSPLVVPNGTIYVGCLDRKLYSLTGDGQPLNASAPWPSFHNDAARQGLAAGTGGAVNTAPIITAQPAGQTVITGSSLTMTAAASGSPAPTFQWRKGGANISGATNATFTIANVGAGDTGAYTVVATNSAGSATSNAATVSVVASRLMNETVTTGHGVTFSALNASGSIQWQVSSDNGTTWSNLANGGIYSGASTSLLSITNAASAQNGLRYRFVATDNGSVATSSAVSLTVSQAFLPFPTSITADGSGNLWVGDANTNTIQKVTTGGVISLVAGTSGTSGSTDGTGSAARFNQPNGLVLLSNGTLTVADTSNATIRSISTGGVVTTLAGTPASRGNADGSGNAATFSSPTGLSRDTANVVYVADAMNHTIRKVTSGGAVSTFAGSAGSAGFTDGTGSAARFNFPSGIAVDASGTAYVADTTNNLIRKITPAGVVTTVAGLQNVAGYDDGTGSQALFNHPSGLAVDGAGNLYVADTDNSTIRKITPAGVVTTVAGLPTIAGLENGSGIYALFNHPQALAVDGSGNIFVADTGNATIRKIDVNRNVTTLALTAEVVPPPTPTPPPTSPPTPTPTPPSSSGGGGGGGAPTLWFLAALSLLAVGRRLFQPVH